MPLDTRLPMSFQYPQIEGPMDQAQKVLSLQGLIQQQQHREMQMQQMQLQQQQQKDYSQGVTALGPNPSTEGLLNLAIKNPSMAAHLPPLIKERMHIDAMKAFQSGKLNDPDALDALSMATGNPAWAREADKRRALAQEQTAIAGLQDRPQQIQKFVGQAPDESAALTAVQESLARGQPATVGVEYTPEVPATTTASTGGALSSLLQSPIPAIANHAKALQQRINAGAFSSAAANQAIDRLAAQEGNYLQQQGMQADRFANRPERPISHAVVQDPTSPTGWSHFDLNSKQIVAKGAPPPASTNVEAIDARKRQAQYQQQIQVPRQQLQQFESYEQAKETWKAGEKVPQAYVAAANQFIQMARGNAKFKADIEQALGGGNIAQRIWGSLSRVATGEPSNEQLADLDRAMTAMATASANNIGTVTRNTASDIKAANLPRNKVIGGPKVYGSFFIGPDGRVVRMKSNAAALKAAQLWRDENEE